MSLTASYVMTKDGSDIVAECLTAAAVTGTQIKLRTQQFKRFSSADPSENCISLLGDSHGREILCGVWLSSSVLCTGGEDGSLREMKLHDSPSTSDCSAQCTLFSARSHRPSPAAVRCVDMCTLTLQGTASLSFIVIGGARQFVSVYYYNAFLLEEQGFRHLSTFQLPLDHDERLMCVSTFALEKRADSNTTMLLESSSSNCIVLHSIFGTSSGKVVHNRTSFTADLLANGTVEFLNPSALVSKRLNTFPDRLRRDEVNTTFFFTGATAVYCCAMRVYNEICPNVNGYGALLIMGSVDGTVDVYVLHYFSDRLHCRHSGHYRAHQVGTTAVCISPAQPYALALVENSSLTKKVMDACSRTAVDAERDALKKPLACREDTQEFPPSSKAPLFVAPTTPQVYYAASSADDNSIAVKRILLNPLPHPGNVTLEALVRIPRAHMSSVRGKYQVCFCRRFVYNHYVFF